MKPSLPFGRHLNLAAIFIILVSLLNVAIGAPLPRNGLSVSTLDRRGSYITFEEYVSYLKKYYPQTDKYLLWTGNSEDQLLNFKKENPSYLYYKDFFNTHKPSGVTSAHYEKEWPVEAKRQEDGEAASKAVAHVATKEVLVFGGVDYKEWNSFYKHPEVPELKDGLKKGRLQAVKHMEYAATKSSQVLATQDVDGDVHYLPGKDKSIKNSSAVRGYLKDANKKETGSGNDNHSERPYGSTAVSVDRTGNVIDSSTSTNNGKITTSNVDVSGRPISDKIRFGKIP